MIDQQRLAGPDELKHCNCLRPAAWGLPMNLTRYGSALVSGWIAAEALLLLAAPAMLPNAPYADLVPNPEEIIWLAGEQQTVWLSTNLHAVEVEIDSIALGLGDIEERSQGQEEPHILGVGPGCVDLVVASLTVEHDTGSTWQVSGTIDRGPNTTGDVEVHVRYYRTADQQPEDGTVVDVTVSSGSDDYSLNLVPSTGVRRVQVSTDEHFPSPFTRQVDFDPEDTSSGGTVTGEEVFHMIENTGLGLVACGEEEDVLIILRGGPDGEELNRYLVDVGPAPPVPTAVPAPTATPSPDVGYAIRRVCVDDSSSRSVYLNGSETVGAAFDRDDFRLGNAIASVELAEVEAGDAVRFYFEHTLSGGSLQLLVSEAGAGNTLGLDSDRVYPVRVWATATGGATTYLDVGVWLDTSTTSPDGDGLCS